MSFSSATTAAVAAASSTVTKRPDPDRTRRVAHALTYFKEVWYFMACFIALVALGNWIGVAYVNYRERQSRGPSIDVRNRRGSFAYVRRFPLAVIDTLRALAFRWTIPLGKQYQINVMDVLASTAYISVIFTWSLINSTSLRGVKYDPRYWGNVAGNIAASQLPLIAALGMKNNIISFLTGISFDKLTYLHRMTARSVCALIWLHAGGRIKLGLHGDQSLSEPYMQSAIMAAVALTILSVVAIRPVRERHYEIFLVSHFVFVLMSLLGAYFHANAFELGRVIWPVFIFWGLDRVIRVLRVLVYNYGYFFPKRSEPFKARIDVVSPNLIRMRLYRPNFLHWRAGQCVYLTLPEVSKFPLEAHPFTISTIDVPRAQRDAEKADSQPLEKELVFLLRVRDGITGRLFNVADAPVTVFMDGPYGSPPVLKGTDSALLIAGGSGISFTLPLLLDLLHRAKTKKVLCKRVTFIWAVREVDDTNWMAGVLAPALKNIPDSLEVDIQIYVTNAIAELDELSSEESGNEEKRIGNDNVHQSLINLSGVTVQYIRPSIEHIVLTAVHDGSDALSVNVCGVTGLTRVVQRTLRAPRFMDVLRGGATVTLHVEAFGNC
ncbi:iron reductase [Cyathus striatus]|nr:iron reductase [Cyathus striatus]